MEGHERFPNDNWLIEQAAIAADGRYSYEEALRLWRRLIKLRKVEPSWLQRYAHNLTSLGRFDEAGEILVRARRKHPRHVGLEIGEGILAAAKEDWMPAIDILSRFQAREPDNPAARELLGRVLQLRALAAINSVALQPLEPVDVGRSEDKMVCNLLLCFESLGYDCEFGLVQRHYGGEPLGFLRWNTTTTIGLLLGLASQFEAVGCAEHLTLTCDPESSLYYLHDARFDLQIHTFLSKGQIDEHKLIERMSKVLRYLRDKFFDDVRAGEKIFVYSDPNCDLEFIFALKTALARYQPSVRLLWVMPIDIADTNIRAANNAGDVAKIGENLFVGFLSRAGGIDGVWDIAFEEWIAICQKTKVLASDRLT